MRKFFIIFSLSIIFFSCSIDLDLNADYKDITIIYGLLDKNSDYQYIKVNKAFLGDASVAEMAAVSDSFIYKTVQVSVKKYKDGEYIKTIPFEYTDTIQKDSGFFANDRNVIYITDEKIIEENELNNLNKFTFKLEVKIPNKELITSTTKLVGDTKKSDTTTARQDIALYRSLGYESGEYLFFNYHYINADNTFLTQVYIQSFFYEKYGNQYKLDSNIILCDGYTRTYSPKLGQEVKFIISGEDYYNKLHKQLENDKVSERIFYCVRVFYENAGFNFTEYIEQTQLDYSIANNGQAYSNINNAYGVFSSRSSCYSDYGLLDFHSGSLNHLSDKGSPTVEDRFIGAEETLLFYDENNSYDIYDLYHDI